MSKLPRKLRIFRARRGWKNSYIAEKMGVSLQSVVNWASEKRCPAKIELHSAKRLVEITNGYVTLKDCGHE